MEKSWTNSCRPSPAAKKWTAMIIQAVNGQFSPASVGHSRCSATVWTTRLR